MIEKPPGAAPVTKQFFQGSTVYLARALLGAWIVLDGLWGKIVETEAYLRDDPGSHAYRGMTKRNAPMFGPAGRTYVYFIYGMYHCLNIVSGKTGEGEAVLIRAVEPVRGIEIMRERRRSSPGGSVKKTEDLCSGPGKLTRAFGITKEHNDIDLLRGPLSIYHGAEKPIIQVSTRVGLTHGAELPLRFFCRDNAFVSKGIHNERN
jgi:DNA-3-methyladenine glycosylase